MYCLKNEVNGVFDTFTQILFWVIVKSVSMTYLSVLDYDKSNIFNQIVTFTSVTEKDVKKKTNMKYKVITPSARETFIKQFFYNFVI